MSWLRDHLHSFVYPSLLAMENLPMNKENEAIAALDLRGEAFGDEILKGQCLSLADKEWWLRKVNKTKRLVYETLDRIETLIKPYQRLILTGRDTWFINVAARKRKRLKDRVFYTPKISRLTAGDDTILKACLEDIAGYHKDDFWLDTGFAGSIFDKIRSLIGYGIVNNYQLMSSDGRYPCIFGKNERDLVTVIEEWPSYWESATIDRTEIVKPDIPSEEELISKKYDDGFVYKPNCGCSRCCRLKGRQIEVIKKPAQALKPRKEFLQCAYLTREIWRGSLS